MDSVHVKERVAYALFPFKVHTMTILLAWHWVLLVHTHQDFRIAGRMPDF